MTVRVFISYRREDQSTLASWLHEKLTAELDADDVFLDTRKIKPGAPFPDSIRRAIESATVYAVLIGPRWNPVRDGGLRRLDDDADWVRQEISLALEHARADEQRLLVPVLCEGGKMPGRDELPACLHAFSDLQAFRVSDGDYSAALHGLVQRLVERLDALDSTPADEQWVREKIRHYLELFDTRGIARIGMDMKHEFKEVSATPESPRALARAIYRIGPRALRHLVGLGARPEQLESLLELLATNWIKPTEAAKLRVAFRDAHEGRRVPIECEIPEFTPEETLLKASRTEDGWAMVTVKPGDEKQEIVQQIHDELLVQLQMSLRASRRGSTTPALSAEERIRVERDAILKLLEQRRVDEGGAPLPFVLHATPEMAKDPTLLKKVQQAFPPLHILISTPDADELRGRVGHLTDVVRPFENEADEISAFEAYAEAHDRVIGNMRKHR